MCMCLINCLCCCFLGRKSNYIKGNADQVPLTSKQYHRGNISQKGNADKVPLTSKPHDGITKSKKYDDTNIITDKPTIEDLPIYEEVDEKGTYENEEEKEELIIRKYVAIYDFEPDEEGDVAFKKNDLIEIVEDKEYMYSLWCKGKNLRTKQTGLVPLTYLALYLSLESEPWFFDVTSFEAENNLLSGDNESGCFLVRPRRSAKSTNAPYALSVRCKEEGDDIVRHFKIYKDENENYFITKNILFHSLSKLIKAYMIDNLNCLGLCVVLTTPYPKTDPEIYALSGQYRKLIEINRDDIQIHRKIGEGISAEVFAGQWKTKQIAIKQTRKTIDCDVESFLEEANLIKKLQHKNIVALFGVCSKEMPCYIIMEYMPCGNLLKYLQSNTLTQNNKLYICHQICNGMVYLESQSVIHRDLAARNILVGSNLVVKISDFGLSRHIMGNECVLNKNEGLPLKWLAPECFFFRKFSHKSDVWSFGILMMEIFTDGAIPYPEYAKKDRNALFNDIKQGYRMRRPKKLNNKLYIIMYCCWDIYPECRPAFKDIYDRLSEFN